jgi:hypothetical protein
MFDRSIVQVSSDSRYAGGLLVNPPVPPFPRPHPRVAWDAWTVFVLGGPGSGSRLVIDVAHRW